MTVFNFDNGWEVDVWDCQDTSERIRGFVADGSYMLDYDKINYTFSLIATPLVIEGLTDPWVIDWTKPIEVYKGIKLIGADK